MALFDNICMGAYSQHLWERVVRAVDRGDETQAEIAERFSVSPAWIKLLLKRRRETGSYAAKAHGGGMPAQYTGKSLERPQTVPDQQPDATLAEPRDRSGVAASIMAVSRALERMDVHRKKKNAASRRTGSP